MAVNVSTVDNTTRAWSSARVAGSDGVRADASVPVALECERGIDPESTLVDRGSAANRFGPRNRGRVRDCDRDRSRKRNRNRNRTVDGVDPAATITITITTTIGTRDRRPAMIPVLTSISRQHRPRLATGVADGAGVASDTDTGIGTGTDTDIHIGTETVASCRPSHSSAR